MRSTSRIPKTEGSKIDCNRRPVELPAVRAAQLGELNTRAERAIKTARLVTDVRLALQKAPQVASLGQLP